MVCRGGRECSGLRMQAEGSWVLLVKAVVGKRFFRGWKIGLGNSWGPFWSSGFPRVAFHGGKIKKRFYWLYLFCFKFLAFTVGYYSVLSFKKYSWKLIQDESIPGTLPKFEPELVEFLCSLYSVMSWHFNWLITTNQAHLIDLIKYS